MKSMWRCMAMLVFALQVGGAAASDGATPIADGPSVAPQIHVEFAIYYPQHPPVEPRAALRSRLGAGAGMPKLVEHLAADVHGAEVSAAWTAHAPKDYAPPDVRMTKLFGHGLTPDQAEALSHAEEALVLDFTHPGKDRMAALRNAQLLAEQVARDTHGLLWDDETREVFTPDAWHERRVLGWEGDVPDVARNTVMHFYPDEGGYRCITLGMAKFGEPDLVVENMVASGSRNIGNMINVLAQALVEGASTDARGRMELRLQQSRHRAVNASQGEGLKPNAQRVAQLLLVQGVRQEGDADNRLIRVAFDRYAGPDDHARQAALGAAMYGNEDNVTRVKHDAKLLAARDAARAHLPELRERFNRGLAPGEYIQVKAPFDADGGGHEWMWVEVRKWTGDRIEGTLQNEPEAVKHLRSGQDVVVSQAALFDYIFRRADGQVEGNTTGAIIAEQERDAR